MDCLFCKIIKKEIPADIVYEDDFVLGFRDIHPKANMHVLIVPKAHLENVSDAGQEHEALLGHCLLTAKQIVQEQGVLESGFKIVINNGKDSGQIVEHMHIHVLGGENLKPMPV